MYYEIEAEPLVLQVDPLQSPAVGKALDDAGLHFAWRSVEDAGGKVRKCVVNVEPFIPAKIAFVVDYQTSMVTVPIDRVTLEFHSRDIDDGVLDDLLRFILAAMRRSCVARRSRASIAPVRGDPCGQLLARARAREVRAGVAGLAVVEGAGAVFVGRVAPRRDRIRPAGDRAIARGRRHEAGDLDAAGATIAA